MVRSGFDGDEAWAAVLRRGGEFTKFLDWRGVEFINGHEQPRMRSTSP